MANDKLYRTLSVRLTAEEFSKFEKVQEILQERVRKTGVVSLVKKPDTIIKLVDLFLESVENKEEKS